MLSVPAFFWGFRKNLGSGGSTSPQDLQGLVQGRIPDLVKVKATQEKI